MQKTNKETDPALVGIELQKRSDYEQLLENMRRHNVDFTEVNKDDALFGYLV
jgi:threonine dehydratase